MSFRGSLSAGTRAASNPGISGREAARLLEIPPVAKAPVGTTWRALDYDDSTWAAGVAPFYLNGGPLPGPRNTPVAAGPMPTPNKAARIPTMKATWVPYRS